MAQNVDEYIAAQPAWQQTNLKLFRQVIHDASPNITEEIKWNVPTFLIGKKIIFAMSAFKAHTKFNFIENGALLEDSTGVFNNSLESKKSRAIDLKENETVDATVLINLVHQALAK